MTQSDVSTRSAAHRTLQLYRAAKLRIPGGTQLLSKRPEMFAPDQWPAYYSRAKGAETWDLDGKRYIDMSISGIGACILGFADDDVDAAVVEAIRNGSVSSLNCVEDLELADLLCEIHPWAEMVRYGRAGGEAMAIAVRIARAHTRRDKVAFCGYHGWHDWYLAANLGNEARLDGHLLPGLEPRGVPRGLAGTALPFRYNAIDELRAIASAHRNEIAAVVMEPIRDHQPEGGFLEEVRSIATEIGAVMIFDEITAAFRMNSGGMHLRYGVNPDIAVFSKAMSNGYPMAAVIGRGEVMQSAATSFISSTHWTERVGPTAALATIRKHRRLNVGEHLNRVGLAVQDLWSRAAQKTGLQVKVSGIPPLGHLAFDGANGQAVATLYTQLMLDRGFLASKGFYASYAHREEDLPPFETAVTEVFGILQKAISRNDVEKQLRGPVAHTGFQRLT
jgi:glutamate-1-semialdehyde 2,1-aminomutase